MIIKLFFDVIIGVVDLLLSLIPTIEFNFEMPNTSFFSEMLGLASYFFPVGSVVAALGVLITVQNVQFILKVFNFIYKKFRLLVGKEGVKCRECLHSQAFTHLYRNKIYFMLKEKIKKNGDLKG